MSNHNNLCRDGIFSNLQIKGKRVIDSQRNLNAIKNATFRGDVQAKKDLTVCGNIMLEGDMITTGRAPIGHWRGGITLYSGAGGPGDRGPGSVEAERLIINFGADGTMHYTTTEELVNGNVESPDFGRIDELETYVSGAWDRTGVNTFRWGGSGFRTGTVIPSIADGEDVGNVFKPASIQVSAVGTATSENRIEGWLDIRLAPIPNDPPSYTDYPFSGSYVVYKATVDDYHTELPVISNGPIVEPPIFPL